jgi:hypothetical protein
VLCAPACVCGFAAFHCLSFPPPCSLCNFPLISRL